MSLPLSRRIARTALLVAAGAASAVGAAGSANAAELLPPAKNLGGVSNLDGANLGDTIDDTSRRASTQVAETGSEAVKKTVPTAGRTVGAAGKAAVPAVRKTADDTVGTAGSLLGETAGPATDGKGRAGKAVKSAKGKVPAVGKQVRADSLTDGLPVADKLPPLGKNLPLL
ncbi:ATP-binding protein [Streptomyces sp. CNQ085]|uniref:ATP-binding protein n=1 Tax=Streptomyces sp. CNQ085 TaxID=2886944 RepID=UPI001F50E732|nr:ATP-binding protein [Streptomyces sp. CNQ085]MCI0385234.1 ATP-binding protein [Streptomyces sp. CNQ085]